MPADERRKEGEKKEQKIGANINDGENLVEERMMKKGGDIHAREDQGKGVGMGSLGIIRVSLPVP